MIGVSRKRYYPTYKSSSNKCLVEKNVYYPDAKHTVIKYIKDENSGRVSEITNRELAKDILRIISGYSW